VKDTIPVATAARNVAPALPSELTPAAVASLATSPADVVREWLERLLPGSRRRYARALRQFGNWATGADQEPADVLRLLVAAGRVGSRQLALGWRAQLESDGRASSTISGYLSAVAGAVTSARLAGLVDWSIEKVSPRIEQREDRTGPARSEVAALLEHIDNLAAGGDHRASRDAAIVRLLHNSALRVNEVVQLRVCHIDLGAEPAVHTRRKGQRERERMLIGARAAASLRLWLDLRDADTKDAAVFVRTERATEALVPISTEAVRKMLRTRSSEAGVTATVRPHGLRHTAATQVARTGSVVELKRLGGWKSLSSPARYLDRLDTDRAAAVAKVEL